MLHIDTKKLGRIVGPSHRVTGNRRDSVVGAGWETLFVAIDDHVRIALTDSTPMRRCPRRCSSYAMHRRTTRPWASRSSGCSRTMGRHSARKTLPWPEMSWVSATSSPVPTVRRPMARQSGSVQSALREWAYGFTYQNSSQRTAPLDYCNHHYNWHRRRYFHVSAQSTSKQPLDTSQLALHAFRSSKVF